GEFAITKQVNLVFADVVWTEAVRRTAEVLRKILHRMDVGTNRVLRVVATLEFIQHQLSEMGHSDLLVTQTLHGQQCWGRPRGSVRRASGLVQTPLWPPNCQRPLIGQKQAWGRSMAISSKRTSGPNSFRLARLNEAALRRTLSRARRKRHRRLEIGSQLAESSVSG